MKNLQVALILIVVLFISSTANSIAANKHINSIEKVMTYKERLVATKAHYPFAEWRQSYKDGLKQYTKKNCERTQKVFDDLIDGLIAIGENAAKDEKVKLFKTAVLTLNDLNNKILGLIETMEREQLCELINQITIAAGLNPKDFAEGEGVADEWREW